MKKILSLFSFIFVFSLNAQNIVTSLPQYKSAVLEEYTGIYCQFCPDGHRIAKAMKAANPGRVVLVNVHEGGYANPQAGAPDFRTPWGTALRQQTGLQGYPAGTINRHVFPAFNAQTALSRGAWPFAAEEIMEEISPAAIGASTTYDANSRQLTVNVEVLYSSNAANSYNLINIALIQDSIPGPQTGGSTYNPSDIKNGQYIHGHMLRDFITGQWGDTISNTTAGSLFAKTYNYTLPMDVNGVAVNPDHVHLAIYVTETRQDITQGITVGIDNDTEDGNNAPFYGSFTATSSPIKATGVGTIENYTATLNVTASGNYDFELVDDAPLNWSGTYKIDGTTYNGPATINLNSGSPINVEVDITTGASPALANYTLVARPAGTSNVALEENFYAIQGISDLIVSSTGGFGDGQVYNWGSIYESGLNAAGLNTFDLTDAEVMRLGVEEDEFGGVQNIYFDAGWTFPPFTDEQVDALADFMDDGGNLFIAGQDIGWAVNTPPSSGGYKSATNYNFFTNYLHAFYRADGGNGNNQLTAINGEAVFGNTPNSAIIDRYNNNFYPDELDSIGGSKAIFNYNNGSKIAGLRYEDATDNYKVVYLGVGLEMLQNSSVSDAILQTAYQWFNGIISQEEFDGKMAGLRAYPNPVVDELKLLFPESGRYHLQISDMKGATVREMDIVAGEGEYPLNLKTLQSGSYVLSLEKGGQTQHYHFVK